MAQTEQAIIRHEGDVLDFTAPAAITGGEVFQLPDGRAAVCPVDVESGKLGGASVCGVYRLKLTDSINILNGGRVYWDHSANKANYKKVSDRDFYVGRAVADRAAGTGVEVDVALNIDPPYDIDMQRDAFLSVPTGTQAVGGFGFPKILGGAQSLELTATNEAQCIDLLSVDQFSVASNAIVEAIFRPAVNGSTSAVDFNIGVATGTSTTDADGTTENCLIHIDGGALTILAQSDDNVTPVTAVDTTKVITAGSAVANRTEVWFDLRNPADIQIYVDGVNVLPSSVFIIATGPLALLAHLEKTSSTATGRFIIDALRARFMET
jgi:predicted RecA/RadA family phage recombinase